MSAPPSSNDIFNNIIELALRDDEEAKEAARNKCWLKLHNLSEKRGQKFEIKEWEGSADERHREKWAYKLFLKDRGEYEGHALTKQHAKELAAKRALEVLDASLITRPL